MSLSSYSVVHSVQVGVKALVVPPPPVGDLGADVAAVWSAEALFVVVPAERVLGRAAEPRDVQAVLVLFILHTKETPHEVSFHIIIMLGVVVFETF